MWFLRKRSNVTSHLPQLADEEDEHEPEERSCGSRTHQNDYLNICLPFIPCKKRRAVKMCFSWAHKLSYNIDRHLWGSKENSLLQICRWDSYFILLFICLFWEIVYKEEVETHFGVYFVFVWDMHTTLFPIIFSSKHCFSNHPCRRSETSYALNLHKVFSSSYFMRSFD